MNKVKAYLMLPAEISDFERQYLKRMNRIALVFFFCHVPVFMGIALIAGTSVLQAAILTPLALVGPALAYKMLTNPRHLSVVFGFTAMCMGGLLVHFGQGSMQIEMHFYFFVLIALLAVFANPLAIITAAVTVALHHLVLFFVLPRSVFNYDASIWAVAVHAAFVVLESVAACFVARSFFDNVIGLEKIVKRRTEQLSERQRDMRLVLDNVGQGFLTINLDGTLSPERSAVADLWLGPYVAGKKFWDYLPNIQSGPAGDSGGASADTSLFEIGWESVVEDVMPLELSIEQLPKRWPMADRICSCEYRPVLVEGKLTKMLLVMSDVTAQIERERFETEQRDFLRVFEHVMKDRNGFLSFFSEANEIVSKITLPADTDESLVDLKRRVHTLKGNCAQFGLSRLTGFCHDVETNMLDRGTTMSPAEREQLGEMWGSFVSSLHVLLGSDQASRVEIEQGEYRAVRAALEGNVTREEIALRVKAWEFENAERILHRCAEQARAIASRLGKMPPDIVIEAHGLRLLPEAWAEFWSVFTHAIRNAMDHGIEPAEERVATGKSPRGQLRLTTCVSGKDLVIEIADDGRGIAWDLLRDRAQKAGIPHSSRDELVEALFRDGLTTKSQISEFSGRGIGMGAIRSVCEQMGGTVEVETVHAQGTMLRFRWPNVQDRVDSLVLGPMTSVAPEPLLDLAATVPSSPAVATLA
jgi:two-component system chemotaxis sensor kinase CheA